MAAYVINHILGGGSSDSRLYQEVREKRGLAYSVSNSLIWLDHSAVFLGGTATRADRAGETVDLIQKEIHRFAEQGPTAAELAEAKNYVISSFALNLDTSTKIAALLVQLQLDDLGIDYFHAAQRHDRCGDARRRQARRQAPPRQRHAGDRRRQARRRRRGQHGAGPGRLKPASGGHGRTAHGGEFRITLSGV